MKRVLLVSNVYGECRYWMSEQRRMLGFMRYLPESGWATCLLVKRCRCDLGAEGAAVNVPAKVRMGDSGRVVAGLVRGRAEAARLVVRVECRYQWAVRVWRHIADVAGVKFRSAESQREVEHLVFPASSSPVTPHPRLGLLARILGRAVAHRDEQDRIDWVPRGIAVGSGLVRELGIDAVLGSFPSAQNLEVAAGIAVATGIPWVADFRDSVTAGYCCGASTQRRLTPLVRHAQAIVYASAGHAAMDARMLPRAATIVENGFLQEELEQARAAAPITGDAGVFVLRFLGALYPMRNLDVFLDGLALVVQRRPQQAHRIRFEYNGQSAAEAAMAVAARGLAAQARVEGAIPSDEALRRTVTATALVLPTNTAGFAELPGAKFYEYLGAHRPVLAAGGMDRYVADVLRRTRCGELCTTPEHVAEVLGDWFDTWLRTGAVPFDGDDVAVNLFSRRHGAKLLARDLDRVAGVA